MSPSSSLGRFSILLAAGVCTASAAFATTPIQFNPDGQGADAVSVGALDWLPGSALISTAPDTGTPAIPLIPDTPAIVQSYAHGILLDATDPDDNPLSLPGLNATFEITFVASGGVLANPDSTGTLAVFNEAASSINFFQMYYDDFATGVKASSLEGTGFSDGEPILAGQIVDVLGNFVAALGDIGDLDQFAVPPNQWPGVLSVTGEGGQSIAVLVQSVDKRFFPEGVDAGTILAFNNSQIIPFQQSKPSRSFDGDAAGTTTLSPMPGAINGISGPDILLQIDANNAFEFLPPAMACRVTGGGNDTSGFDDDVPGWDGTTAAGSVPDTILQVPKGNSGKFKIEVVPGYEWTMGGQAGANSAKQPQPKGEWEHNNHSGPAGLQFAFHGGTASASPGTEIDEIICTDPGFCRQARPAPSKQIDFVGIGEFSNFQIDDASFAGDGVHTFPGIGEVVPASQGCKPGNGPNSCNRNPDQSGTYHWFQVHIEDAGEPGNKFGEGDGGGEPICPIATNGVFGHGNDPFLEPPRLNNPLDCGCADFYRITIYRGFEPEFNTAGEVTNPDKTNRIYEVWGYLDGGNFQIHPQTGFDLR